MRLRIASRRSDLARIQAFQVGSALKTQHPGLEIEYLFKESLGDKNLTDPLWKLPEKGVFTEDFHLDLLQGKADLVVHSWKDLPTESKPETEIAATLTRADVRDLLIFKKSSKAKLSAKQSLVIFSSSPRREYNLKPFLRDYLPFAPQIIQFQSVRGNVPTRLRKMSEQSEIDGLIVAKAAFDRLLSAEASEFNESRTLLRQILQDCDWMVLPLSQNPAAAAQGALAIEILRTRQDLKELLAPINSPKDFLAVQKEREILSGHGGGCHQKIGVTVLQRSFGEIEFLRGLTDQGVTLDQRALLPEVVHPSSLWIESSSAFFRKQKLMAQIPTAVNALYVSHPESWFDLPHQNFLIWTAGLKTWKKLAELGVWVHGSSEGLGEKESMQIQYLKPQAVWGKLGHRQAVNSPDKTLIPTYELVEGAEPIRIPDHFEAYFWKSASLFDRALKDLPFLKQKKHFCGPGHTFDHLKKVLPSVKVLWPAPNGGTSS